jgi:hypothetical protein
MDELNITGWGPAPITCQGAVGDGSFTVDAETLPEARTWAVGDIVINGWPIVEMTVSGATITFTAGPKPAAAPKPRKR